MTELKPSSWGGPAPGRLLFPAICMVIGFLIFIRFAFNRREYAAVREVLSQRHVE